MADASSFESAVSVKETSLEGLFSSNLAIKRRESLEEEAELESSLPLVSAHSRSSGVWLHSAVDISLDSEGGVVDL